MFNDVIHERVCDQITGQVGHRNVQSKPDQSLILHVCFTVKSLTQFTTCIFWCVYVNKAVIVCLNYSQWLWKTKDQGFLQQLSPCTVLCTGQTDTQRMMFILMFVVSYLEETLQLVASLHTSELMVGLSHNSHSLNQKLLHRSKFDC